jgi:hypothetical protein
MQKSLNDVIRWCHTSVILPKPLVSSFGYEIVCSVPERARNKTKDTQKRPHPREIPHDPKNGIALGECQFAVDQHKCFQGLWTELVMDQQTLACLGLQCSISENTLRITSDEKLNPFIAHVTDSVKKYNRVI